MSEVNMFVPLEIDLIDEGRFVGNVNNALRVLQEQLISHTKEHGLKAEKAKASLKAEIVLVCLNPEQQTYGCAAAIKTTLPATPPAVSLLMGGNTQTGKDCLLCKKSGSSKDHPQQKAFLTEDGRLIDSETGEAKSEDR